ncbi:hypothetical protein MPTK1_6g12410 [Marchantia polymorpha subsp. ruderalis]|uniref:Uncharacterized protein n=2 Tax=Marchantia polymorpha TaxID=3197 RepID=A0AAF6BR80_MARPO|nr:hypothetical protein MARPO_0059s0105 [Marchantia polymorpha]BBN14514.1 hypothetical protein Mp_6g12410 [Marchantia polymorpha subsp. ruderalis]|eukprot:PTQ37205.1 hypothetical protein MARPO_0059s0105 [Marchantia polymorpha]
MGVHIVARIHNVTKGLSGIPTYFPCVKRMREKSRDKRSPRHMLRLTWTLGWVKLISQASHGSGGSLRKLIRLGACRPCRESCLPFHVEARGQAATWIGTPWAI